MKPEFSVSEVQAKPFSITIINPGNLAFNEACALIRQGYITNPDMPPEIVPHNGQAIISLILGAPDQVAIDAAKTSTEHALLLQQVQYERDVKEAAKQLVAQQQRDELEKAVAAEITAHEKKIKEIQKAAAAAASKLQ